MVQIEIITPIGGSRLNRVLLIAALLTAAFSLNASAGHSTSKNIPSPCDEGFDLQMSVKPVDSIIDASAIGVRFTYTKKSRGLASRIHTKESSEVNKTSCELWQKKYWHLFNRVLAENKDQERKGMICHNVANVRYRIGARAEQNTRVCLGSAHDDGLSHAFQKIYSGTDFLVQR